MDFHAPNGRRTPFDVDCTKGSAQRATVYLGSNLSASTPPWLGELLSTRGYLLLQSHPDPLLLYPGLWTGLGWRGLFIKENPVVWMQLLPLWLPSHQHVSLHLHYSGRAATEAEKTAEWDRQQRVWLRLEVGKTWNLEICKYGNLQIWAYNQRLCNPLELVN